MKMSSEDGVDDKTNMDEGEYVWEYVEIWGALTNIQILFGYAPESMTTDLICGITHDKLIELMMNSYDITREVAESRVDTIALQAFIDDVKSNKLSGIDDVLTKWKREQGRKAQRTGTWRPVVNADINRLLVELEQLATSI